MKKIVGLLSILAVLVVFAPTAFCADIAKIGIVSYQTILNQSNGGKAMKEEVRLKKVSIEKNLKSKQEELEKEQKKLQKDSFLLAPEKLKERKRSLRIKINDFKTLQKESTIELKAFEDKLLSKFQKDITIIVNKIGKKEGYLLILDKNSVGIAYAPAHTDITSKILKKYNSMTSK